MNEKDMLNRVLECLVAFSADPHPFDEEFVKPCIQYIESKANPVRFDRNDKEQWDKYKDEMYSRLERKSPMTMFELTLGMPDNVGPIILDELVYGRMYQDLNHTIGVRKS